MIVGYDVGGAGYRRFDGEHLRVEDDGRFELWLLSRSAVVGEFSGRLTEDEAAAIGRLAAAVPPTTDESPLLPGARRERWLTGPGSLAIPAGRTPAGAWGALITAVRGLVPGMTACPRAALALQIAADWRSARLRQVGSEGLDVESGPLAVDVAAWDGFEPIGRWRPPAEGAPPAGERAGERGWSVVIPLRHRFRPRPGRRLEVSVGASIRTPGGNAQLVAATTTHAAE